MVLCICFYVEKTFNAYICINARKSRRVARSYITPCSYVEIRSCICPICTYSYTCKSFEIPYQSMLGKNLTEDQSKGGSTSILNIRFSDQDDITFFGSKHPKIDRFNEITTWIVHKEVKLMLITWDYFTVR